MKRDLVIGLDCSTTASKAIVWSADGAALGEGRCPLPMLTPRAGWHEPEVFSRTLEYLDVAAFLVQRLCGFCRTGWGCADPTGMFDMTHNSWAQALLDTIGIRAEQLPEAFPPGEILGNVTATAARATGLPVGTPIVAGVGDGPPRGRGTRRAGDDSRAGRSDEA